MYVSLQSFTLRDEAKEKAKTGYAENAGLCGKTGRTGYRWCGAACLIFLVMNNVFRDDVVTNGDDKEAMLVNAPKAKEGQYQVPKTIG